MGRTGLCLPRFTAIVLTVVFVLVVLTVLVVLVFRVILAVLVVLFVLIVLVVLVVHGVEVVGIGGGSWTPYSNAKYPYGEIVFRQRPNSS
jgi:hypothetical protein